MDKKLVIKSEFMHYAIEEAQSAAAEDEVPVGAVIVKGDRIIAKAHNMVESLKDPSAHAEMLALKRAAEATENKWLSDCVLYVTLEPCAMCAGAIVNFRVGAVAFGAFDPAAGCCISKYSLLNGRLNNTVPFAGGIEEEKCSQLLSGYFAAKRQSKSSSKSS